ncbi:hypothetical protein H9P43_009321 [Blastocladiella emersonii ATCC 22665]|nr:hypothetical protein H9P43_009321 [Blastocladiella emersonii ATCC 22665]
MDPLEEDYFSKVAHDGHLDSSSDDDDECTTTASTSRATTPTPANPNLLRTGKSVRFALEQAESADTSLSSTAVNRDTDVLPKKLADDGEPDPPPPVRLDASSAFDKRLASLRLAMQSDTDLEESGDRERATIDLFQRRIDAMTRDARDAAARAVATAKKPSISVSPATPTTADNGPAKPPYHAPLRDVFLRSVSLYPLWVLAWLAMRLVWAKADLLAALAQTAASAQSGCQTLLVVLEMLPTVPQRAVAATASATTQAARSAVTVMAGTLILGVQLGKAVIVQFAASQTHVWRCLVDMVLRATFGVLSDTVGEVQGVWNTAVAQLTGEINKIIDALNGQLLDSLGTQFQAIFGGPSITTSAVRIPQIPASLAGQFVIPDTVAQSFTAALGSVPSAGALFDQLETVLAQPFAKAMSDIATNMAGILDQIQIPTPEVPPATVAMWRSTPEWQALQRCACGSGLADAMEPAKLAVEAALGWWCRAAAFAAGTLWITHLVSLVLERWWTQRRGARLSRLSADDLVWRTVAPMQFRLVGLAASLIALARRVTQSADHATAASLRRRHRRAVVSPALERRLARAAAFLLHRPMWLLVLPAAGALAVIWIQRRLFAELAAAWGTDVGVERLVASTVASVIARERGHLTSLFETGVHEVERSMTVLREDLIVPVASPVLAALTDINATLTLTSDMMTSTVRSLLAPVPAIQTPMLTLVQCMVGGQIDAVNALSAAVLDATAIPLAANWTQPALAVQDAIALAQRTGDAVVASVGPGAVTAARAALAKYNAQLDREQDLALAALGVALAPLAAGWAMIVFEVAWQRAKEAYAASSGAKARSAWQVHAAVARLRLARGAGAANDVCVWYARTHGGRVLCRVTPDESAVRAVVAWFASLAVVATCWPAYAAALGVRVVLRSLVAVLDVVH